MLVRDIKAALYFDTETDTVTTANSVSSTVDASMACWFNRTGLAASGISRILAISTSDATALQLEVGATGGAGSTPAGVFAGNSGGHTSTGIFLKPGEWNHLAASKSGTTVSLYLNGILVKTFSGAATVSGNSFIGAVGGAGCVGIISDAQIWTRALTASEILSLYNTGIPSTTNLVGWWKCNEGAGTSLTDSSGSGNTGTISGALFTGNTPCKARQLVNQNLIKNGDFEYAPPFTAATTTNQRWIDGTASGSTTNDLFGWAATTVSGTVSAKFDSAEKNSGTYSLKLSTLAISSYIESHTARTDSAAGRLGYVIPVLPNTSYTYSFYMKTNYVSGDATNGAFMKFQTYDGGRAAVGGTSTTAVKVTQDWTRYTASFTTEATARFIVPKCAIYGHQGTGTLIMDAWYDSIELYPTTPTTRATA